MYKTLNVIMALVLTGVLFQCQKASNNLATTSEEIEIELTRSAQAYTNAQERLTKSEGSDPFVINSVSINDNELKMFIEVSYSGGCEKHEFNLVWPESITEIDSLNFTVILNHNANEDSCEAWLTKNLVINLKDDALWLSNQEIRDMTVTVINGSNPDEKVRNN
ncbi:MAG: hypothetical protein L3J06_03865 [Cyclobacteriaceae bacterium]|nr:hypothetical protein [Cyclobacteriaceae bacterium]